MRSVNQYPQMSQMQQRSWMSWVGGGGRSIDVTEGSSLIDLAI
jgi:hypothetical protein